MPQVIGTVMEDSSCLTTNFTGTATSTIQNFSFLEAQNGMFFKNNGSSIIALTVEGVNYKIPGMASIMIGDARFNSFDVSVPTGTQTFDISSYIKKSDVQEITDRLAEGTKQDDLSPIILDMHHDLMHGRGFVGEPWNSATITADAAKGDTWLYFDTTNFPSGQLLSVLGADGKRYTIFINYKESNRIGLLLPLPCDVKANTKVFGFWVNFAHPTLQGYQNIADYAVNTLTTLNPELIFRQSAKNFTNIGSPTVTDVNDFNNGYLTWFGETKGVKVVAPSAAGIEQAFTISEYSKYYNIKMLVTTFSPADLKVQIYNTTTSAVVMEKNVNTGNGFVVEFNTALDVGNYKVRLIANQATTFFADRLDIFKNKFNKPVLSGKKHLFLGDSWIYGNEIIDRFKSYFPSATCYNFGVPGNGIQNLINRFTGVAVDGDKTNSGIPDSKWQIVKDATKINDINYVWVICGTNDYITNADPIVFKNKLRELILAIIKSGAKPIIFTSSVGDINKNGGAITQDILTLSRRFADFYL